MQDLRVGVVDFDFVNECRLKELGYCFWWWKVVSQCAVVYPDGGDGGEVEEERKEIE